MSLFDKEGTGTFDFRPIRLPMDEGRLPQRATLSLYRLPWCQQFCFWLDVKVSREVLFERLLQGFNRTGGAPAVLLVRPTRPFGQQQKPDAAWMRTFRRFCQHYQCDPHESKSHFPKGTPWLTRLMDTIADTDWTTVAQCQEALDRLAIELSEGKASDSDYLLSLPTQPFCSHQDMPCRVASDGFLRYANDYYSVPFYCVGRTIWVRRTGMLLRFYNEDERLVAQHTAGPGRGKVQLYLEHFRCPPLGQDRLVQTWRASFPADEAFLSHLLAQRKLGATQTIRTILDLTRRFRRDKIRAVFLHCQKFNNYSHRFILGILEAHQPKVQAPEPMPRTSCQQLLFQSNP